MIVCKYSKYSCIKNKKEEIFSGLPEFGVMVLYFSGFLLIKKVL